MPEDDAIYLVQINVDILYKKILRRERERERERSRERQRERERGIQKIREKFKIMFLGMGAFG